MPTPHFLTGFGAALSRSLSDARRQKQSDEELKLKQTLAKNAIELQHRQQQKLDQEQQARQNMQDVAGTPETLQEAAPSADITQQQETGYAGARQSALRRSLIGLPHDEISQLTKTFGLAPVQQEDPTTVGMRRAATAAFLKQNGMDPAQFIPGYVEPAPQAGAPAPAGPMPDIGMTINPKGAPTVRMNPPKQGVGAQSRQYADYEREQKALGKSPAEIRAGWQQIIRQESAARAQGPYDVQAQPSNQAVAGQMAQARGFGQGMGRIGAQNTPQAYSGAANVAAGSVAGKPLDAQTEQAVNAMADSINVAKSLTTEFTPEERAKYVGVLRYPTQRLAQFFKNDPKFARFQTLVARAKSQAFGEGGKQLTPFEASVVFGYVPTGTELSPADFEAKLQESLSRSQSLIDRRIKLGTTPRAQVTPGQFTAPGNLEILSVKPLPPRK